MGTTGRAPGQQGKGTENTIHNRKRRPRLRFRFGVIVFIWVLVFGACFGLYMFACNLFGEDPDKNSSQEGTTQAAVSDTTEAVTAPT